MSFTLRILFTGLFAYIPNKTVGKPMRILIIDGRAPGISSPQRGSLPHVSHIPSVRFNIGDMGEQTTEIDYLVHHNAKEKTPKGMWVLNGDDLEIRCDGIPLPEKELTVKIEGENDLFLIPAMKNIYPESNGLKVDKRCLDDNLEQLSTAGLVGRIRLKSGVVGSYPGLMGEYVSSQEYTFTNVPNGFKQRVVNCMFYETEIESNNVEIFSKQLGKGLTLHPADGKIVEVIIENEPPRGIGMAKPGYDNTQGTDIDFELVYKIASQQPSDLRIPITQSISQVAAMFSNQAEYNIVGYNAEDKNPKEATFCSPIGYNAEDKTYSGGFCSPIGYNAEDKDATHHVFCAPIGYNAED